MEEASPFVVTAVCLGNICRSPMAEAVLRLRALQVSDHWVAYLRFHLERESFRNHSDPRVAKKAA